MGCGRSRTTRVPTSGWEHTESVETRSRASGRTRAAGESTESVRQRSPRDGLGTPRLRVRARAEAARCPRPRPPPRRRTDIPPRNGCGCSASPGCDVRASGAACARTHPPSGRRGHRVPPHPLVDLLALQHPALGPRQEVEQLELAPGQLERRAGHERLELVMADLHLARDERRVALRGGGASATPADGLDAGDQLLGMARLGQPVVSAQSQPPDALGDRRGTGARAHLVAGGRPGAVVARPGSAAEPGAAPRASLRSSPSSASA